jgi:hypothetical protein
VSERWASGSVATTSVEAANGRSGVGLQGAAVGAPGRWANRRCGCAASGSVAMAREEAEAVARVEATARATSFFLVSMWATQGTEKMKRGFLNPPIFVSDVTAPMNVRG